MINLRQSKTLCQVDLSIHLELISDAPDCFERPFVADALQLFAQALDVNVDRSRVAEVIKSPDLIKQLVARENPVVIRRKEVKKLKLFRRDLLNLALDFQLIFAERNFNIVKRDRLAVCFFVNALLATENRLYSDGKLLHIKRLHEIIVRAEFKQKHLIKDFILCRNHDDGLV